MKTERGGEGFVGRWKGLEEKNPQKGSLKTLNRIGKRGGGEGLLILPLLLPPFLDCYTGKERKEKGAGENRKKNIREKAKGPNTIF